MRITNYPDGAEFDPAAPWNERDEPDDDEDECTCRNRLDRDCPVHAELDYERRRDDELTRD